MFSLLLASLVSSESLGSWVNIGSSGVVCIHTAVLPGNKLLCYARPHMPPYPINPNTNGLLSAEIDLMHKVNSDGTWESKFTPISVESNPFCGGHALLGDGSVLAVGGDNQSMPLTGGPVYVVNGRQAIRKFIPCAADAGSDCVGKWVDQPSMSTERWYPSVVTLADGSAIIIGGQTKNIDFDHLLPTDNNPTYEYFPAKTTGTWPKVLDILVWAYPHNLYPQSHLLPSGKVFVLVSNKTIIIDPQTDTVVNLPDMPVMDHSPWIYPHTPTMFVLPLTIKNNFTFTLMICGGNKLSSKSASSDCLQITPESSSPKWTVVPNMPVARLMPDAVILPDGKILVVNGLSSGQAGGNQGQVQYASGPVFQTDMYDPISNTWSTLAPASNMRLYHSGALLLQTGHVVTTGSEMDNYLDFWGPNPNPNCYPTGNDVCTQPFNYNIERFTPPYLQNGARPVITQSPSSATHGSLIRVDLDSASQVSTVSFIRTASTTHSTNSDQRMVELVIEAKSNTSLYIRLPSNTALAPVGNWYLFVLNENSVPSVAATVNLQLGPATSIDISPDAQKPKQSMAASPSIVFASAVFGLVCFAMI